MIQRVSESANAVIGRTDLQKLRTANQVVGKWGTVEFKLTEAGLTALKELIARQTLIALPQ